LKSKFLIIVLIVHCQLLIAQNISIGTWRTHISFNAIKAVDASSTKVYAASDNGVLVFDKSDNSLSTITKLQGLSSSGITSIAADPTRQQVLVSYSDGILDIIKSNEVVSFTRLKNSTTISGSKKINHITVLGNFAYLATDYGVVVFDLIQLEVKETYRDLGVAGAALKIYKSTFKGDSIFIATENGVLAGDLDDNLLDFTNWKRFSTGTFSGSINQVTFFNAHVYTAINGSGIYRYENNGSWQLQPFVQGLASYSSLQGSATNLVVTESNTVWSISTGNVVSSFSGGAITTPNTAVADAQGKFWIGDSRNGLVSDNTGLFASYITDGPSFSSGLRLKYGQQASFENKDMMFAVSGGFDANYVPAQKEEFLNYFVNGFWETQPDVTNKNITDVGFISPTKLGVASYGYGVQISEDEVSQVLYNNLNSTLTNNRVTAIETSAAGLWVAEYGVPKPLHLFNPSDNTWESFSIPFQYPIEIKVDYLGQVWMVNNPSLGGGIVVYNKEDNKFAYLTDASGAGGLPSRTVYSIAMDRDGQVWVGTAAGAAYFPNPSSVFNAGVNAVKPIFENRFLLRDERVIAIEVDGGNRKWMGTERGVWLFDSFGEAQVYNFNAENSPLLSNRVSDIEISAGSGEVFFLSDNGIVSFRADATESTTSFKSVKIFPNPVTAQFNGLVGISGLSTDATVKITDVSGKLVWQTYANGGTATWNVRDYNGNRAATGMYLVLAVSADGSESVVGKIAVVN
jgi:ligand-binding sensor domain-containing protein